MTPHRWPLLQRELSIAKKPLAAIAGLYAFGVAFLYVSFDGANRYRLLAEPMMLRSLALPVGLLGGAALGWLSFVSEMRSGTWEGWLLLPRSRAELALAKLGVGAGGLTLALALPTLVVWALLASSDAKGGPDITLAELLFQSALSQGVLVALATFFAAALAALLAREAYVTFPAPLLVPLVAAVRFFVGNAGFHGLPEGWLVAGLGVASAAMAAAVFAAIVRAGRRVGPGESALRALLLTPATMLVAMVVLLSGWTLIARLRADEREAGATWTRRDAAHLGVRYDGHIGPTTREVSMYSLDPERHEERGSRLRTPIHVDGRWQLFRDGRLLSAFDAGSGARLGCIGADGLRERGPCTPFDAAPRVARLGDRALVLTETTVYALGEDGEVARLWTGDRVGAFEPISDDLDEAVAVVVDDGLALVRASAEDGTPRVDVVCRGAVSRPDERVEGVALVSNPAPEQTGADSEAPPPRPFVAARVERGDGSAELLVCRDGEVVERGGGEGAARPPPARAGFGSGEVQALAVGPVLDRLAWRTRHRGDAAEPWAFRAELAIAVAVASTVGLGLALLVWGRKRPQARAPSAWWLLPGLAIGPAYVLACALLFWRRPRWAGLVGR